MVPTVRWCTVGDEEQEKCYDWSQAVNQDGGFGMNLSCVMTRSRDECLVKLEEDEADLVTVDAGEVFLGGRYHSLIPIMTERYGTGADARYYAVAVVKRSSDIRSPEQLRGRRACFPGVGEMAGWVLPIYNLFSRNIMEVKDCNNHLKSVAEFFGPSCAINALNDKHNPTGDNPFRLCDICAGISKKKCTGVDPYAGFDGAFTCLAKGMGEVAFVKQTTVDEMLSDPFTSWKKADYELLCPFGNRVPIDQYEKCNWGVSPGHAVLTSSAKPSELRHKFQSFLKRTVQQFARRSQGPAPHPNLPYPSQKLPFSLFESFGRYGYKRNLIFSDLTNRLDALDDSRQTFKDYLGKYEEPILALRQCPVGSLKLCVVSDMEMDKCNKMGTAFRAQMLQPELICVKGYSHRDCMVSVSNGIADITVLDAGDVYTSGKDFGLIPIIAEHYNLGGPFYYAVAVARIQDKDSDLLFLRGKHTCHTGMGMAAGWVIPVSFLLLNERLRNHGCDGPKAASEFFQKSCIPGALSPEFNPNWKQNNMCDLCHGSSSSFCQRDHHEDFFGYTGALRCLVEGGGDIAFVKHTTVFENTDGRNRMWWARNVLAVDFELLCRDGSRAPVYDYHTCNLGQVPSNAIVARPHNETKINAYINLFLYAQQFYGSKFEDDFNFQLFRSEFPYHDLIFQDATQQLQPVDYDKRHYHRYLGHDFLQAKRSVDCTAKASTLSISFTIIIISFTLLLDSL